MISLRSFYKSIWRIENNKNVWKRRKLEIRQVLYNDLYYVAKEELREKYSNFLPYTVSEIYL